MIDSTVNRFNFKQLSLGFLANMLGFLTFILLVYVCLATVAIFFTTISELARARAENITLVEGPILQLLAQSLLDTLRNGLNGIWGSRLGFLIFGILGIFAAGAYQIGRWIEPKRAWFASFLCLVIVLAIMIITWAFAQREYIALWMAESPELYRWRDTLIQSYTTEISVGLIFALFLAYPMWIAWRWWYSRLLTWTGSELLIAESDNHTVTPEQSAPQATHRAYAARLQELKSSIDQPERTQHRALENSTPISSGIPPALRALSQRKVLLPLAVICIISLVSVLPIQQYHQRVALRLQHDTLFVNARTQAEASSAVRVDADNHRLRIVNIEGLGSVEIYLSPTTDITQAVEAIDDWTFEWRVDEYLYNELDITNVTPGDYYLHFIQRDGWGWFEYTLSHGGGTLSHILAFAIGFLLVCGILSGMALLTLLGANLYYTLQN